MYVFTNQNNFEMQTQSKHCIPIKINDSFDCFTQFFINAFSVSTKHLYTFIQRLSNVFDVSPTL